MAKEKTRERSATAGDRAPKVRAQQAFTPADVANRAYDLYLARGSNHGHDIDDWLQAERELRVRSTPA
jgi:DUF2934 family protein